MQIREKEGSRQLADIENAMFLAKQKALADSETSVPRSARPPSEPKCGSKYFFSPALP
jgi:hypothetical protein